MGADEVIDHTQSIPDQLEQLHRPMVEYIFNTSQTDQHWEAMCKVIKPQGRICGIVDTIRICRPQRFKEQECDLCVGIHVYTFDVSRLTI